MITLSAAIFVLLRLLLPGGASSQNSKEISGVNKVPPSVRMTADLHLAGLPPSPTELVRAEYDGKKPKDVPEAAGEKDAFYRNARVLEQRDFPADANGITRRERLVYVTGEKYPKIRVEEQLRIDPGTGAETLISRVGMIADHVLVGLPPKVTDDELKEVAARYGLTVERRLRFGSSVIFGIPDAHLESVPLALKSLGTPYNSGIPVVTAEADYVVHTMQTNRVPNDPAFSKLWGMQNTGQSGGQSGDDIAATGAWSMSTGTSTVVVAVIDTGIEMTHPDLAANIYTNTKEITGNAADDDHNGYIDDIHGWNFVADNNNPSDDHYHGTHCAGTIGAVGDNGNGVAGVNWQVRLLPLKFLSSSGAGATSDAIEAIAYATAMHVDVMSNSWGGGGYSSLLKSAIEEAGRQGIVFIAAAGNDGCNTDITPQYPSGYDSPSIVSVAASDANDQLAGFSNYGSISVDLAAPGVGIYSTAPGNNYRYLNGTSMATPHVAGACALLKALNPSLGVAEIKSRLLASVDQKPGLAATVSHGRLNVMKLLYNASGPLVRLKRLSPSDSPVAGAQGNGDGIINPGENIVLLPVLENTGSETARGISAVMSLKSPNAYVTVTQSLCSYPDIPGLQTATGRVPFRVQIDPSTPTPLTVTLLFQVSDSAGHSWQSTSDLTVYRSSVISGRVTESGSNTALSAATVSYSGPASGAVTTAADGTYSVTLIDGTYSLTASTGGYQSSDSVNVTVPPSASGINFALGKPSIDITPASLEVSLNQGQSTARTLTISNSGNRPLNYILLTGYGLSSYLNVRGNAGVADSTGLPFFEDFESGTLTNWVADTATGTRNIDSKIAADGKYSLHIQSGNTNWHQSGVHHDLPTTAQPKNIRFSLRPGTRQNDAGFFVVFDRNTNKELIWFYAASNGNFYCNGSTGGNQTYAYEAQRWYDIEFRNIDWNAKKFDYYVNGFPVQTGISFRNPSSVTGASRFYLYNYDSGSEAWWDNLVVSGDGVAWLSGSPVSGTIAPGGTQNVTATFNATGLPNADYTANLIFQTNAPGKPTVTVPAILHVLLVPNTPPVASSKTVTTPEDTDATITLQGSDPDGNLLSAVVTSLPAKGALYQVFSSGATGPQITTVPAVVVSPDFKVLFRAVPLQDGTPYDLFGFKMNDGRADSGLATVTVNVTHVNHAPVARNDVACSPAGAAIPSIPVLINDNDPDNDQLSIVSFTQGIHGTVANNGGGSFSYTPKTGFINGNDTFTYTVRDPAGLTCTATVLIRVGYLMGGDWPTFGVNPQHTGYYPAFLQGQTFQPVWSRLFDYAPNQVAIAGGRIYSTQSSNPATLRSIDLNSGAQVWSRDFGSPFSFNPPTWFNGKLYVQRCNNYGDTQLYCVDAATGTVNWNAPFGSQWEHYYAPAVTADGVWMDGGSYGGLYGFNLDGTQKFFNSTLAMCDQWAPTVGSDGTIYSWVTGTFKAHNPSSGAVLWSATTFGTWYTYSMNNVSAVANNKAYVIGAPGLYCFNLQTHTQAWSNSTSFTGSPAVANGIVYAITGSQVQSFDATTGASLGVFQTSDTGLFFQPVITDDSLLVASSSTTYIFSLATRQLIQTIPFGGYLSLSDGALAIAGNNDKYLRVYRIAISGNHVPVATAQSVSMIEDKAVTVTLSGMDADVEPVYPVVTRLPLKGTLYQTADGVTRGSAITVVPALLSDPQGRVIYAADQYGSGVNFDSFGFEVSDGRSISPEAAITLNVTHVNHAPVAVDDVTGTRAGQAVTVRPTLNDQDVDLDPLTIQSFTQGGHGTVSTNADGTLLYTPGTGFTSGQDTFSYTVSDPSGLTSSANVKVAIGQLLNGPDWPTFGNGPAHTGYSPTNIGSQLWLEQWNQNFGTDALNQVAVGDGRVFVAPTSRFANAALVTLDSVTGAEIWRCAVGAASSMNPPTYANGRVYFQNGKGTSTPPSQLTCLDSGDGHSLWVQPIAAQWESYFAPTVANGGVWVDGGNNGGMYGFDAVTGVQKFFVGLQQYDQWTPTVGPDNTIYSWVAGTFNAHDPNSGAVLWSATTGWNWSGYSMNTVSASYGGRAYVIGNPGLFSIKLSTHTIVWSSTNTFIGSPAVANGLVYAISNTGEVRANNSSTGQQLYTYSTGDSGLMYQPIVTNDALLVASASKTYIFELYTARLLQTLPAGGKLSFANDKIFIAGNDGTLHVFGRPAANNHKPVAVAAQATILEDSQVALTLEGTDADGDWLHSVVTQLPAKGALYQTDDGTTPGTQILRVPALVSNAHNTVIYVPDADGNGPDYGSFKFAISDGIEMSAPAVFKIDVTPVNDAPVAYNDSVTTGRWRMISTWTEIRSRLPRLLRPLTGWRNAMPMEACGTLPIQPLQTERIV
jgi:subtilisin family serine protease/outer membrane protein assembly factor BamB